MGENSKYSVLIVDDEAHNIDILCRILSPLYNVKIAKSGEAAVALAKKHIPDIILLDIVMPGMDGFATLAELKKEDITRDIPVIFITGLDSSHNEEKGLLLGAVDYITKPFHNSIVKLRVGTHLRILEQMRTLEQIGMIDVLTNVPNRRGFNYHLEAEWARSVREKTPVGLLMVDIDKFKDFNDCYGHEHGDAVLKAVADSISRTLKRASDFVARWGGEEFVVLLPNTDTDGALHVAEQIRQSVEKVVVTNAEGLNTRVTVSIGVCAETLTMEGSLDEFLDKADKALYCAKRSGRNRVQSK